MTKDLTQGNVWKVIIAFSIPLLISSVVQQLYNMADSAIVGNLDLNSAAALAALGAASPIVHLVVGLCTGGGMGCTVIISKLFGEKRYGRLNLAIRTAAIVLGILGIIVAVAGFFMAGTIMKWLGVNEEVFDGARGYLSIYCIGAFPMMLYNAVSASFTGIGDSRRPLYFLVSSSILNVILDIIAVGPMKLGVRGAAWATTVSQIFVAVVSVITMLRKMKQISSWEEPDRNEDDTKGHRYFDRYIFGDIVKVGIPCIFQQASVSIGHILIQGIVNTFGTVIMAGYEVGEKIVNFNYGCYNAMATGLMSFAGQNYGAGHVDRCKQGLKAIIVICVAFSIILAVLGNVIPRQIVGLFVNSSQENIEDVITVGANYIRIVLADLVFVSAVLSIGGLMRGVGDIKVFVVATIADLAARVATCYALALTTGNYLWLYWAWFVGMAFDMAICLIWLIIQNTRGKFAQVKAET